MSASKRQLLPFPREIRDHIYSLLLTGDNVEVEQSNQPTDVRDAPYILDSDSLVMNHPYDFSRGIMSVNSAFAAEASEVFYGNAFVLIHTRSLWIPTLVQAFKVPLVQDNDKGADMPKHWTMKLDINIPHSSAIPESYVTEVDLDMVVLAKDLPLFCKALQWAFLGFEQSATMLLPDPRELLLYKFPALRNSQRASIDIQLRSLKNEGAMGTISRPLNGAMEKMLLEALMEHLTCGDLSISINGTLEGDDTWAEKLRSTMSPCEIYMPAIAWQLLDAMADAHALVSGLYAEGQMIQVYQVVKSIAHLMDDCSLYTMRQVHGKQEPLMHDFVSDLTEPLTRAAAIEIDLFAYGLAAGLRSSDHNATNDVMDDFDYWMDRCTDDATFRAQFFNNDIFPVISGTIVQPSETWVRMVYRAVSVLRHDCTPATIPRFRQCLPMFAELARAFPDDEVLQNDLTVFEEMSANLQPFLKMIYEGPEEMKKLLAKLSVNKFHRPQVSNDETMSTNEKGKQPAGEPSPPIEFKTHRAYEYQKPSHMKGWVDISEQAKRHLKEPIVFGQQ